MPSGFPFALLCLTVTGFVAIGLTAYLLGASRPETRLTASMFALMIAALVAFTPLLLLAANPKARDALRGKARRQAQEQEISKETPQTVVQQWMALYSKDTARAATLTTPRFRDGEAASGWARKTQGALQEIQYEHQGGSIVTATLTGDTAIVTVNARISAIDGVSTQTEVYTLQRLRGHWLIDALEVQDEVLAGELMDERR